MEKKDKMSAREYVRSTLGSRPFVMYFDGVPLGHSGSARMSSLPAVAGNFHYRNTVEMGALKPHLDTLEKCAADGRRAAMTKEFKSTPWYVAAVDVATRFPDFYAPLPSPDYMDREAMVLWRLISDREAAARYMATSVKSLGNIHVDAVLAKVAPWLSEESRMLALAEKFIAKGAL